MRKLHTMWVLGFVSITGCANAVDPRNVYGTYSVMVSAFSKTDTTFLVASEGSDDAILFDFTQGFSTDYNAPNATGLRSSLDGHELNLASQPVHVDHSTGEIDGMLTGVGEVDGSSLSLTLKVLPTNYVPTDANGMPLPTGTTVDYEVSATKQ